VGFLENAIIRIISNFKYKHVHAEVRHKKEKIYVGISTFRFNAKTQNVDEVKEYLLKHLEVGEDYFRVKKARAIGQEVAAVMEMFKGAKKCIPELSLL
jgi:SPX domain protein involved in polyphosphate accumulation